MSKKRRPVKFFAAGCLRCGQFGCLCLNWILSVSALLLAIVLLFSANNLLIPVPEFLLWKVQEQFAQAGFEGRWSKIGLNLRGELEIDDFELELIDSHEVLIQSDSARIGFEWYLLASWRLQFSQFKLIRAEFFCPAIYSPSGIRESVVREVYCNVFRENSIWGIEQLLFKTENLQVNIRGDWRQDTKPKDKRSTMEENFRKYIQACRSIIDLRPRFEMVKDPLLEIALHASDDAYSTADIILSGKSIGNQQDWLLQQFEVSAQEVRLNDLSTHNPVVVKTGSLKWKSQIMLQDLCLQVHPQTLNPDKLRELRSCLISADSMAFRDYTLNSVNGNFAVTESGNYELSATCQFDQFPLSVVAQINPSTRSGHLNFDGVIDAGKLLHRFPDINTHLAIGEVLPGKIKIRADANLQKDFELQDCRFTVDTKDFRVGQVSFNRINTSGSFDGTIIDFQEITVENPDQRISGNLVLDLKRKDWKTYIKGSLRPKTLIPILPKWWYHTWMFFEIPGKPVFGDAALWGNWGDPTKVWTFVGGSGEGVSFKDVPTTDFSTKVWVEPFYVTLRDIQVEHESGQASGALEWFFVPRNPNPLSVTFDFTGKLPLQEIDKLIDNNGLGSLPEDCVTSHPPRVSVKGVVGQKRPDNIVPFDFTFTAEHEGEMTYLNVPVSQMKTRGRVRNRFIELQDLDFSIEGGRAKGTAVITTLPQKAGSRLSFNMSMTGARHRDFLLNLTKAHSSALKEPSLSPEKGDAGDSLTQGIMDLDIEGIGNPNDIRSFNGQGRLEISEADFGKIQVFGLLSRMLEGTWINFTSMSLNKAKGKFDIREDHLHFPKLVFSGPDSALHASGDTSIPDQQLDFRVNVFLGENTNNPIPALLNPILKPMAYALELKLWGTMKDPKWRFTLDPRNMVSPRQKITPPIIRNEEIIPDKPLIIIKPENRDDEDEDKSPETD